MLSEITIANLYIPPLLVYLGVSALVYGLLERTMSLARFFVSLIILSTLVLMV